MRNQAGADSILDWEFLRCCMKDFYPVMLHLDGKDVVVVGGGKVAERKVNGLVSTGARIVIVSPVVTAGLKRLIVDGKMVWKQAEFTAEFIKHAFMVFAVTDD